MYPINSYTDGLSNTRTCQVCHRSSATTIDFNVRYQTIFIRFESRLKCKVILDSMEKYGKMHIKTISEYVSFPVSIEYIPSAENECEETY